MRPIVTHTRKEPGRFSTLYQHILDRKIAGVERGAVWLLEKVARIGPQARCWGEALVEECGVEGLRVLQGLLALADRRGGEPVDRACELALAHGCFRLRTVRELTQRDLDHADQQPPLPGLAGAYTDERPIIRPLCGYGRLVHEALLQPRSLTEQRT